ncbi:MAG: hypothetical protein QXP94_02625 [Thermofilaceae archaeon]
MMVKTFDFYARFDDPIPRTVKAKGRLYLVENHRLTEVQGTTRTFILSEDALHFDMDFGDALQLSIADIAHAISRDEFDCKVSLYEAEGVVLKLYDVLDNNSPKKLVIVFKPNKGEEAKRYVWSMTNRVQWQSRKTEISKLLELHETDLAKLIPDWE